MSVVIVPMTPSDLPEVLAIEARSYPLPWDEDVFRNELALTHSHCLVARTDDSASRIFGYAVFWKVDEAELLNLAVHPDLRGQGLSKPLLAAVLSACRDLPALFLEVRAGNAPAIALYRGAGFQQVALRKRYYRDNDEDALILRRTFDALPEAPSGTA
jgi:ribosomal-protein-alanine N-acetyltransferase